MKTKLQPITSHFKFKFEKKVYTLLRFQTTMTVHYTWYLGRKPAIILEFFA